MAFGLKRLFGKHVHCFFAEPTHSPAMLLGLVTGEHERICVQDLGLDNQTEADGLAVGRPSALASKVMEPLLSGVYTIEDNRLYEYLDLLMKTEQFYLEPSALAGMAGPEKQPHPAISRSTLLIRAPLLMWSGEPGAAWCRKI